MEGHPVIKIVNIRIIERIGQKPPKGNFLTHFHKYGNRPTYYCNLKCPMCPREVGKDERKTKHMPMDVWDKILTESKENKLNSIQLSHELV